MDPLILILFCLISGLVGSALGFGGAMILAPACFWVLPPAEAVMTLLLLSNLTNLLVVTERRQKHFDKPEIVKLLLSTLPGIMVGIILLQKLDPAIAITLAGFTILLGVGLKLLAGRLSLTMPSWPVYPVGLSCGILAATTGLATLAPAWLLLRRLPPNSMRDTLQLYYLIVGVLVFVLGVSILGVSASLPPALVLAGGALAIVSGYWAGKHIFEKLQSHQATYQRVALASLFLVGAACVARGTLELLS